jgi:uncharacterized protein (TIGR02145 family)
MIERILLGAILASLAMPAAALDGDAPATPSFSSFIDQRDGRRYRTLRFDRIEWMRDNLAFEADPSWCYGDRQELCATCGRLYDFERAMRACPIGWRLPTDEDWMRLEAWAGLPPELLERTRNRGTNREGAELRVYGCTGFDALLAGYRNQAGSYTCKGRCAAFWSSSETADGLVWHRDLDNGNNHRSSMWRSPVDKDYALSARCVRTLLAPERRRE